MNAYISVTNRCFSLFLSLSLKSVNKEIKKKKTRKLETKVSNLFHLCDIYEHIKDHVESEKAGKSCHANTQTKKWSLV